MGKELSEFYNTKTVEIIADDITTFLKDILNLHAPMKMKYGPKSNKNVNLSKSSLNEIKKRKFLTNIATKSGKNEDWNNWRKKMNNIVRDEKKKKGKFGNDQNSM